MSSPQTAGFVERRGSRSECQTERAERRQFAASRDSLDPEVSAVAEAIDAYKIAHHRRYLTLAEVLEVVKSLGYHK